MKSTKRITAMILSVCMLLGLVFVPAQAREDGSNGSGHRGDAYNNGVTAAKTPISSEESGLLWAKKLQDGQYVYAGPPMYANGSIYTYWKNKIYKLNRNSGEVEAEGTLDIAESQQAFGYSYFPVAYGDGKVYVGLLGGKIQALDANTLENKWIYTDESKSGDANSPITYKDGKIYMGFSTEVFVCLSSENGECKWRTTEDGSFYYSGAAIVGDYVVYTNEKGNVISRNKEDGTFSDKKTFNSSAVKASSVCYNNGKIYFMTASAVLVVADFDTTNGEIGDLKMINDSTTYGTTSVSTPVVYNGIVYVGVGGWRTGYNVIAIDPEKEAGERVLWSVRQTASVSCSALLSNAYEKDGFLYLYVTYNSKPGGINVIKAKTDGSGAEGYALFDAKGYEEYCAASVIADDQGTLYYKNDSGYVMAIASNDVIANADAAAAVEKSMLELPSEDKITLEDEEKVTAVRNAYGELSEAQKALVTAEKLQLLTTAEKKIETLKAEKADKEAADKVIAQITALGEADLSKEKQVEEARAAYEGLTAEQKKLVTNLSILEKAEQTIKNLKNSTPSTSEKPAVSNDSSVKEGMTVKSDSGKAYVKVLSIESKTVEYVKPAKKTYKNVTVTDTVKISGVTYKVTAISANAFKGMKKLQKVTIGKNVQKIGAKAFTKCQKLNKVIITSKKISSKTVSSKAFAGTKKKIAVKVPKNKYKAYKKFLIKKGNKTIKIIK